MIFYFMPHQILFGLKSLHTQITRIGSSFMLCNVVLVIAFTCKSLSTLWAPEGKASSVEHHVHFQATVPSVALPTNVTLVSSSFRIISLVGLRYFGISGVWYSSPRLILRHRGSAYGTGHLHLANVARYFPRWTTSNNGSSQKVRHPPGSESLL